MGPRGKEVRTTTSLFSCLTNPSFPFLVASLLLPPAPSPSPALHPSAATQALGQLQVRGGGGRGLTQALLTPPAGREDTPSFAGSQEGNTPRCRTRAPFFKEARPGQAASGGLQRTF